MSTAVRRVLLLATLVAALMAPVHVTAATNTLTVELWNNSNNERLISMSELLSVMTCPANGTLDHCVTGTTWPVQSSGELQVQLDDSAKHRITVTGYRQFKETFEIDGSAELVQLRLRTIQLPTMLEGIVTRQGEPLAQGFGILLCPIVFVPCGTGPGDSGVPLRVDTFGPAWAGQYSVPLNPLYEYNVRAVIVDAGDQVTSDLYLWTGNSSLHDFDVVTNGVRFTGAVTRTGFDTFPPRTAGVGACETGTTFPGTCSPRIAYANPAGAVSLRLPPGTWNIAGFIFIDGSPVVGADVMENTVVPDSALSTAQLVGTAADGSPVPGVLSADLAELTTPTAVTVADLDFATGGNELSNVAVVPSSTVFTPIPDEVLAPYGAISFTSTVPGCDPNSPPSVGSPAVITVALPDGANPGAWYKLIDGTWEPFAGAVIEANIVTITIVDGGDGDADGIINCFVTDPAMADVRPFSGFLDPIRTDATTVLRAGRTVPIRWRVFDEDGLPLDALSHFDSLVYTPDSGAPVTIADRTGPKPKYIGDGYWQFNWKPAVAKGSGGVLTLTVTMTDESPATARLAFK